MKTFEPNATAVLLARVFSTPDGQELKAYLQALSPRAVGPHVPEQVLWFNEGQRKLLQDLFALETEGRAQFMPQAVIIPGGIVK